MPLIWQQAPPLKAWQQGLFTVVLVISWIGSGFWLQNNHALPEETVLWRQLTGQKLPQSLIEIRFPVSWIYSLGQRQGILTAEIAYRDFLGTQGSEIRWFAEVSQNVLDRITLVAQLENTNGLAELQTDLTKLTGNVQVKVNPNLTLVVGGFRHIQGPSGQGLEFKVFFSSN